MLSVTAFGWGYLAVAIVVGLGFRPAILALLVVSAVLHAPAVVVLDFGGARFGLSAFLVTCVLVGADLLRRVVARRTLQMQPHDALVPSLIWFGLLGWTVAGSMLLPHLFEGMPVHLLSAREPVMEPPRPLRWDAGHLGQIVNAVCLLLVLVYLHQLNSRKALRALIPGFAWAILLSVCIGVYQRLAMLDLVSWYPEFWGSNPSYNQNFLVPTYGPNIGRVGLPFAEPLYAGVWFAVASAAALCWWIYGRCPRRRALAAILCVLSLGGLANSMGTAGIAAFAGFVALLVVFHAWHGRSLTSTFTSVALVLPLAVGMLAAAALLLLILSGHATWFADWSDSGYRWIHDKYVELFQGYRRDADREAIRVLAATWGLGAGSGSLRASGYFTSMLGNAGLPGLALFVAALWATAGAVYRRRREIGTAATAWGGAIIALLIGIGGGIADQAWPVAWIVLFGGVALVLAVRVEGGEECSEAGSDT